MSCELFEMCVFKLTAASTLMTANSTHRFIALEFKYRYNIMKLYQRLTFPCFSGVAVNNEAAWWQDDPVKKVSCL